MILIIFLLFISNTQSTPENIFGEKVVKINTTTDSGWKLYQHWLDQAISALMAAVAHQQIEHVSYAHSQFHEKCAKNAKSVREHAKCVVQLLDRTRKTVPDTKKIDSHMEVDNWIGSLRVRAKREVVSRSSYSLMGKNDRSPFGIVARHITNSIRILKDKKENRSWRAIMASIVEKKKEIEQNKKVQEMLFRTVGNVRNTTRRVAGEEDSTKSKPNAAEMYENTILEKVPTVHTIKQDMKKLFEKPNKPLSQKVNKKEQKNEQMIRAIKLLRDGVKFGMALSGQNTKNFENKTVKLFSPRLFPLVPEQHEKEDDEVNILSPSLFSLHSEGKGVEKATSLSQGLGILDKKDQDDWMDLITEAAGITEAISIATKTINKNSEELVVSPKGERIKLSEKNITDLYGSDSYRQIKVLEKLHSSYTKEQMEQFNSTGYTLMTDTQRRLMYGKDSPYSNEQALNTMIPKHEMNSKLHKTIRLIASGATSFSPRLRDIVKSPIIGSQIINNPALASQALILSPVLFTPLIYSPAIFGSVILSPWLFVPIIVSPRILSPVIVSPALFSPIVLSPLMLNPVVLTPGLFNPFILSPFLLTPIVLSPQVMTPLILSPYALAPDILSPFVMSPIILSPFVLSPVILSPPSITAVILSPYALSPSIASPPNVITVFASPSALS